MKLKLMRWMGLMSLPLLLTACESEANYQAAMNSWQGANIQDLIQRWGPPVNSYKAPDGNQVYMFYQANSYAAQPVGGVGLGSNGFATGVGLGYGASYDVTTCTTWAEVNKSNQIVKMTYKGNACVASNSDVKKLANPFNPPMEAISS